MQSILKTVSPQVLLHFAVLVFFVKIESTELTQFFFVYHRMGVCWIWFMTYKMCSPKFSSYQLTWLVPNSFFKIVKFKERPCGVCAWLVNFSDQNWIKVNISILLFNILDFKIFLTNRNYLLIYWKVSQKSLKNINFYMLCRLETWFNFLHFCRSQNSNLKLCEFEFICCGRLKILKKRRKKRRKGKKGKCLERSHLLISGDEFWFSSSVPIVTVLFKTFLLPCYLE